MSTPQDPGPEHRPRHAKPEQPEVSRSSSDDAGEQSEVTFSIFGDSPAATPSDDDRPGRPAVSYSLYDSPAGKPHNQPVEEKHQGRPGVDYGGLPVDLPGSDAEAPKRQTWSTVGFVFAGIALLFFPIVFGVIGIGFGLYAHKKGETLGYWSAIAALTALLAGLAIRIFFFDAALIPEQN